VTIRLRQWALSNPRLAVGWLAAVVGAIALGLGIAGVGRAGQLHEALSYVASGA